MDLTPVFILCSASMLINLPFGFYRMGVSKYSWRWFLAIHLPIPFLLLLRLGMGVNWRAIPFVLAFAIIGQITGGMIRRRWALR